MSKKWLLPLAALLLAAAAAWYWFKVPKFVNGEHAADFSALLADGSTARLSELRGQYVLLQFWGSWCGPCRAENQALAPLYRKFHDRGFEVFSVGIEAQRGRWLRAIESDSLAWRFHTVEPVDFSGPIAKQYGVRQIPATWLIDPKGTIIGVNLSPEKMDALLTARLLSK